MTEQMETMSVTELRQELQKAEEELADLVEERQAFLGQMGVHIGVGLLKSRRRLYEREEERLNSRISELRAAVAE